MNQTRENITSSHQQLSLTFEYIHSYRLDYEAQLQFILICHSVLGAVYLSQVFYFFCISVLKAFFRRKISKYFKSSVICKIEKRKITHLHANEHLNWNFGFVYTIIQAVKIWMNHPVLSAVASRDISLVELMLYLSICLLSFHPTHIHKHILAHRRTTRTTRTHT